VVSTDECDPAERPTEQRSCYSSNCQDEFYWVPGEWQDVRIRHVYPQASVENIHNHNMFRSYCHCTLSKIFLRLHYPLIGNVMEKEIQQNLSHGDFSCNYTLKAESGNFQQTNKLHGF
jgi:hypothetical protein